MAQSQEKRQAQDEMIGNSVVGNCAECGAVRGAKLDEEDIGLAERKFLELHGEPGSVYRFCDDCYTAHATILLH